MKYLALVRDADSGVDGRLTTSGHEQMYRLSRQLKEHVGALSVRILSSSAPRAKDAATILSQAFEVDSFEAEELWWSHSCEPGSLPYALARIRECAPSADVLVVVTHREYVDHLPERFGREELGVDLPPVNANKGEAVVIDCEQRSAVVLGRLPGN